MVIFRNLKCRLPLGAIGMIALILVVEGHLGRRADEFRPLIGWNNLFAHRAAKAEASRAKVLCLGDSLMKLGVQPAVLQRRLGLPAYNLGVIGSEPPITYFLLRQALEAGARPDAIVVDFAPNLAKDDPRRFVDEKCEAMDPRDILDLALTARSASYIARLILAKSFPSIRYRDPLRAAIAESFTSAESPMARADRRLLSGRQYLRHWTANLGANALLGEGALNPGDDLAYLDPPWSVHEVNWIYIDRLLRLAASRQVPVYWLVPTFAEDTSRRREALGVDADFARFVVRMQSRHPGVRVLDARRLGLPRSMFSDPGHLNAPGATAQSLALAEALASPLSGREKGRRWVELKRIIESKYEIPVEDFDASCRIVAGRSVTHERR